MDRPLHPQADPEATPDRDHALAEIDPWGLGKSADGTDVPSTHDIRALYLRLRDRVTASAAVSTGTSVAQRMAQLWAAIQSHRRIVAGAALFALVCALVVGLWRYDFRPLATASGATYNTAVARLESAASAALEFILPASAVASESVAVTAANKGSGVRPATRERRPISSSRALELTPAISPESVRANAPAAIGIADPSATAEAPTRQDDSELDAPIIYSPRDADIAPPVAMRSPGIAKDGGNADANVLLVDILVGESGEVESARARQRPSTLGAAVQSNLALSVVMTWRFSPARKDGQPVKYRTTVPFVETMNVGRED